MSHVAQFSQVVDISWSPWRVCFALEFNRKHISSKLSRNIAIRFVWPTRHLNEQSHRAMFVRNTIPKSFDVIQIQLFLLGKWTSWFTGSVSELVQMKCLCWRDFDILHLVKLQFNAWLFANPWQCIAIKPHPSESPHGQSSYASGWWAQLHFMWFIVVGQPHL